MHCCRSRCLKTLRRIISRSSSSRITQRKFVSFFKRTLTRRYVCGRPVTTKPPKRCGYGQLSNTIRIATRGITKLYCRYKRLRIRITPTRFLNRYFRKNQYRGYLRRGALSRRLSRQLPKSATILRRSLLLLR